MSAVEEIQAVTFGLGAEVFAVPVTFVKEILDYRETFRIPGGPDYLLHFVEPRARHAAVTVGVVDQRHAVDGHAEPIARNEIAVTG